MNRLDRLLKEREESRDKSALSSRSQTSAGDNRLNRLLAERDMNGFREAYTSGYEALQGAYGKWNSAEAMDSYRNTLTEANKAMSDYINTYSPDKNIMDAYDNFSKALGDFDKRAELYSVYQNEEAFNKARKKAEYKEKYKGSTYDAIQKALSKTKDADEAEFLKGYTEYSSLEDFDKAIAKSQAENPNKWSNTTLKELNRGREQYEKENAFDKYKSIMAYPDFEKVASEGMADLQAYEMNEASDAVRGMMRGNVWYSESLNEEQRKVASYLYKKDEKAYLKYMEDMSYIAYKNEQEKQDEAFSKMAEEHPVLTTLGKIVEPAYGYGAGIANIASAVRGQTQAPTIFGEYISGVNRAGAEVSQKIKEEAGGLPAFAYDVFTTAVPNRIGQMMFGQFYNVAMGLDSFSNTYSEKIREGASTNEAIVDGLVAGAIEFITEQVGMEWAFGKGKNAIQTFIKQFLSEGSEEVVGQIADSIYQVIAKGGERDYAKAVNKYKEMGYEDTQAYLMAQGDFAKDVAYQFAVAGFSTVPTGGVQIASQSAYGSTIDSEALTQALQGYGEDSDVYKDYLNMLGKKDSLGNWQKAEIYSRALDSSASEVRQAKKDLVEAIKNDEDYASIVERGDKALSNYNSVLYTQKGKLSKQINVGEKTADSEGNDVHVDDVVKEDGELKFKAGETTYDASDMTFDEDTAYVMNKALQINDEAVRQAYIAGYEGGNSAQYDANVALIVDDATRKIGMDAMLKSIDTNVISQGKAIDIYNAVLKTNAEQVRAIRAKNDAVIQSWNKQYKAGNFDVSEIDTSKLDSTKKRLVQFLNIFSKMGMNIKVIDDASRISKNGSTQGRNIVINLSARYGKEASTADKGQYTVSTMAHESTHWMENILGEEFNTFKNLVRDYMGENKWNQFIALEQKNADGKLTDAQAESEVIARFCEDMLNDVTVADRLFSTASESTIKKLINAVKKWFAQIRADIQKLMEGYSSQSPEAQFAKQMGEEFKKVQDAWVEMFERALAVNQVTQDYDAKENQQEQFSVKASVEATENLMAIHNINQQELLKTLKLGGFAMPSIAVVKRYFNHAEFGDCSVVFPKWFIDRGDVKKYGGDAWTPVFPSIDRKVDEKKQKAIQQKVMDLVGGRKNYYILNPVLDYDNMMDKLQRNDVVDAYERDKGLQYAFLKDTGEDVSIPTKEKQYMGEDATNETLGALALVLGDDLVNEMHEQGYSYFKDHPDVVDRIRLALNEAYAKMHRDKIEDLRTSERHNAKITANLLDFFYNRFNDKDFNGGLSWHDYERAVRGMYALRNGGAETITDTQALNDMLNEKVDKEEYKKWLNNLFDGIIEKEGIRNNVDFYTASGNRRSWEALHDIVTLENIVKSMRREKMTGSTGFGGNNMFGVANKEYKSVEEMRKDMARLITQNEEEREELRKQYMDEFIHICDDIKNRKIENSFIAVDNASEAITEAVRKYKTVQGIDRYLRREWSELNLKEDTAQQIYDLYEKIANMPTEYFEIKPTGAVYFPTVSYVVIPSDASTELKKALEDNGVKYYTFEKGNDEDRSRVVNEHASEEEGTLFSKKVDAGEFEAKISKATVDALMPYTETISAKEYKILNSAVLENNGGKLYPNTIGCETTANNLYVYIVDSKRKLWVLDRSDYEKLNASREGLAREVIGQIARKWNVSEGSNDINIFVGDNRKYREVAEKVKQVVEDKQRRDLYLNARGKEERLYSSKVDSDGNNLSEDQNKFFIRSEVRNDEGYLLPMYHGTDSYKDFTIFKAGKDGYLGKGMYFSGSESIAKRYAEQNGYKGRVYKVYLNVTNPLIVTSDNPALEILGEKVAKRRAEKNSFSTKWLTPADIKKLQDKGYDGIIWKYGKSPIEVSVWNSNQIKSVDNKHPSLNDDIHLSRKVSDEDYEKLTYKNPEEARAILEATAREHGYDSPMLYHGSIDWGFTRFIPEMLDDGYSIFLTPDLETASTYAGSKEVGTTKQNLFDVYWNMDENGKPKLTTLDELIKFYNENTGEGNGAQASIATAEELEDEINKTQKGVKVSANKLMALTPEEIVKRFKYEDKEINLTLGQAKVFKKYIDMIAKQFYELATVKSLEDYREADKELQHIYKEISDYVHKEYGEHKYFSILTGLYPISQYPSFKHELFNEFSAYDKFESENIVKINNQFQNSFVTEAQLIDFIERDRRGAIYPLYAKLGNVLTIDGQGHNWNDVPVPQELKGKVKLDELAFMNDGDVIGYARTRNFAQYAHEAGYDSVIIKNITDNGGRRGKQVGDADIYMIFNPTSLASADLRTYDDDGKVIPLSERFTDDDDIRYSQKVGYHAGDLGKSESLGSQTGGRDTGHFGTGTYFVGDKSELQYGGYKDRPVYEVDFSKYNLWKPLYEEQGLRIHDFLKGVNRYVYAPEGEIRGEYAWEKLYDKIDNALYDEEYDAKDIYKKLERLFGKYRTAQKLGDILHYGYASDGTLYDENDNEISLDDALSKVDMNDLFSAFDRYDVRNATDYAERYDDWWRSFFDAYLAFNKSEEDLSKIFREVQKEVQAFNGDAYTADSASTRFMKKLGYEGVDVRGFKRLDNTMYGSVIYDLKDEDLKLKQDIGTAKFSNKVDTNELELLKQNKMLEKRNTLLKADVKRLNDLLKLQSKLTNGMVLDDKKLKTQAEVLLKDTRSSYSVEDTMKGLRDVYEYILSESNGGEINWDVMMGKAYELASKMLDEQKPYKWVDSSYKGILDTMRKARIKLTEEQKQEAKNAYGKDWHKEYFGSVVIANDGRSLDSYWHEWAEQYPWVFDENVNPNDMATELLSVYDSVKDAMNVVQYFNSYEDKTALAYEIYNKFWNVPTITTLADKYQAEAKKLKFEHRQAMEELRASKQEAIKQVREQKKEVVKAVREDRDRRIAELKEHIKEKDAKRKDNAVRKATIEKIFNVSQTLMDWMQKNTAKEHVPDVLKPAVSQLLNAIDYSSKQMLNKGLPTKKDVSMRTAIENIRNLVAKTSTDEGMEELGRFVDFPPSFAEDLDVIYATVNAIALRTGEDNAYVLNEMSADELAELYKMVKVMKHVVQNLNQKIAGAYGHTIAYEAQRDIQANKEMGAKERNNTLKKFFEWKNTLPVYAFEHLGEGASAMFTELQDGWDKFAFNVKQIIEFSKDTFNGKQVKEWGSHVNTFKVLVEPTVEELKEGGKPHELEVSMTDTQIMSLYCLSKREHAKTHFAGGGIRVATIKDGKKELVQVQNVRLSEKELNRIIGTLTPEQIEVADKLQEFMNTVCSAWGNEVTMKRYGIKGFTEENYFPIKVDANIIAIAKEARDSEKSIYALLNYSFTKPITPKATAQMEIGDIFDVFTIHTSEMAKYNSVALPVLDMIKYYNYKEIDKDQVTTMKGSIEETFGREAMAYINHFLVDLNGNQESGRNETVLKKLTRGYKTSAVAGNLQVMALQPVAISRASLKISDKYILKGMASLGQIKNGIDEMEKYSGIAVWKDLSLFDTNVSRGLDSHIKQDENLYNKAIEASMKGAEWADKITWGAIWNACKFEARDRGFTGEELSTETAKKFRDIIYHTQVVDSTMTRTDMMRSPSLAVQWATSFMSEPSVSMNILQDATIKYAQDVRKYGKGEAFKRNGKYMAKAIEVYTLNAMVEAIFRGLIGKWRDLDSDEGILEGMWKEFLQNVNPLSNIPLGRDIVSIFSGYQVDRMDMATVQSMYYAYKGWVKAIDSGDVSYKTIYRTMQAMSQATGIPLSSLMREAKVIWNNVIGEMYPYLKIE